MNNKGLVFCSAVAGIFAVIAHCTNIDRCEVGSEGCLCPINERCDDGLSCSRAETLVEENGVVLEDLEERGLCVRVTCLETCVSSGDGTCDDDGEGSDNDSCDWGTDCTDCGERIGDPPGNPRCADTCDSANDGTCDDGGKGSTYTACDWGTDCRDCGPRYGEPPGRSTCTNTCDSANDGDCDDGGDGAIYSTCEWGTDCEDCGPRFGDPPAQ